MGVVQSAGCHAHALACACEGQNEARTNRYLACECTLSKHADARPWAWEPAREIELRQTPRIPAPLFREVSPPDNSLHPFPLYQLNRNLRRHRAAFRILGELHADDRFAGLGVGGDANSAGPWPVFVKRRRG